MGTNLNLISTKNFKLGITPKVGYLMGEVDFGEIELIADYTPPVIIEQGRFTNGDTLSMNIEGIGIQIGITPNFKITKTNRDPDTFRLCFIFPTRLQSKSKRRQNKFEYV
ncbi:MAG: hypothetical protein JSW07_14290 [bacterium]|nr:MAG: hypothetical protein JSW07_14290 [bacterium]